MKFTNIDKIYGVVLYAIIVVAFLYTQGCTLVGLKINDLLNDRTPVEQTPEVEVFAVPEEPEIKEYLLYEEKYRSDDGEVLTLPIIN